MDDGYQAVWLEPNRVVEITHTDPRLSHYREQFTRDGNVWRTARGHRVDSVFAANIKAAIRR